MGRRKGERKIGMCAYCGKQGLVSRDHVIPKALFTKPLPGNMVTVPACDECNNLKSRDEDYLRDVLALDLNGSQNPVARDLIGDKVRRSVTRPGSALGRAIVERGIPVDVYRPSGICLPDQGLAIPVQEPRIISAISYIVRGLYFNMRSEQRLPNDYLILVQRMFPGQLVEVLEEFNQTFPREVRQTVQLGERVFTGIGAFLPKDPAITAWVLMFYGQVLYLGFTEPPRQRLVALLDAE